MSKQTWILLLVAIAAGVVFTPRLMDRLRAPQIQISVTSRPFAPGLAPGAALPTLFGLDREYRLTVVRVTPLTEVSNPHPRTVWHLASAKGSEPALGFAYADEIPGMKLIGGVRPQALIPGLTYRLHVEAGRAHGAADFTPQAMPGAGQ